MRVDRPPPGEELNTGDVTPARPASSLILVQEGADAAELLLVQRNPEARFLGGAWVFPGGSVSADDDGPAATAVRELEEEAGVRLPADADLIPFSRWVTPAEVKVRFDTWFFVALAPAGTEPRVDGAECVDWRWIGADDALEEYARGELSLVFPTIKHLEQLAELRTVAAVLEEARSRAETIEAVQPKIVISDGTAHVLLPGEPGYDD